MEDDAHTGIEQDNRPTAKRRRGQSQSHERAALMMMMQWRLLAYKANITLSVLSSECDSHVFLLMLLLLLASTVAASCSAHSRSHCSGKILTKSI